VNGFVTREIRLTNVQDEKRLTRGCTRETQCSCRGERANPPPTGYNNNTGTSRSVHTPPGISTVRSGVVLFLWKSWSRSTRTRTCVYRLFFAGYRAHRYPPQLLYAKNPPIPLILGRERTPRAVLHVRPRRVFAAFARAAKTKKIIERVTTADTHRRPHVARDDRVLHKRGGGYSLSVYDRRSTTISRTTRCTVYYNRYCM
jgi:hypothetical protein